MGKDEKLFNIYKFRSMTNARDEQGNLLSDEQRLTRFGRFLRKTSLDELPQLFNVIKGDMSMVGPRPRSFDVKECATYSDEVRKRFSVRPGITGLTQIGGRDTLTREQVHKLDMEYIENISFANDAKIFVKTIPAVLSRRDIKVSRNN